MKIILFRIGRKITKLSLVNLIKEMIITDKNVIVLITSYYINYICIIITIQETR